MICPWCWNVSRRSRGPEGSFPRTSCRLLSLTGNKKLTAVDVDRYALWCETVLVTSPAAGLMARRCSAIPAARRSCRRQMSLRLDTRRERKQRPTDSTLSSYIDEFSVVVVDLSDDRIQFLFSIDRRQASVQYSGQVGGKTGQDLRQDLGRWLSAVQIVIRFTAINGEGFCWTTPCDGRGWASLRNSRRIDLNAGRTRRVCRNKRLPVTDAYVKQTHSLVSLTARS